MNMPKDDAYKLVMAIAQKKGYSAMLISGPMSGIMTDLYAMGLYMGGVDGNPNIENLKTKGFIHQDPKLPS